MSALEIELKHQLDALNITGYEQQFRFGMKHVGAGKGLRDRLAEAGMKDWRFDFAWPELKFAVEVEGGAFVNGGHNRGAGFTADLLKYHNARLLGWDLYRCDGRLIKSGQAVGLIEWVVNNE